VAAAALVGGLAFYGAPSVNIAQAADALRSGAQAIVGDSSAEAKGESCPMQRAFAQAKGLCPLGGPACDGDKDKDKSAGFQLAANLNPACDGDKGCDKDKAGFQTAANLTPACDGDKGCDKDKAGFQTAANVTPACDGKGCDKDKSSSSATAEGVAVVPAVNIHPACDGDKDKDKAGVCAAPAVNVTPACDGDKDKDKASSSALTATVVPALHKSDACAHDGACPLAELEAHVAQMKAAGLGCCGTPAATQVAQLTTP
jgi:hypothetical protein